MKNLYKHCAGSMAGKSKYKGMLAVVLLLLGACSPAKEGQQVQEAERMEEQTYTGNPIVPGNFADPYIIEHQDTFYIYATTGNEATVWRSADFVDWKLTKLNWPTNMGQPDIWAPAVTQGKDGRFYLYTSTNHNIYVGVADYPTGPFNNVLGADSIFIQNRQWWEKMHSIDADAFIDDDGQAYLYWGSGFDFKDGVCAVGLLADDMASFKEQPKLITPEGYFEGPHMIKRNGKYYLMYSDGLYYDSTYKVRYAVSDSPTGPFVQGENSPILQATPEGKISGPGHHSTLKRGDDYYIVYHRHVYPFYEGIRQVCIDKMEFGPDGSIKDIVATQEGVPLSFVDASNSPKRLKPASIAASAAVSEVYDAAKAFDGANGTLWAADASKTPAWLQADFGKVVEIAAVKPVFDEVMGAYTYQIEYSEDGETWKTYATGNNGMAKEWPVKHAQEVQARFVRLTITGQPQHVKRVGLWELKVY